MASAIAARMARSRDAVEIAYESHGRTDGDASTAVLVHGWAGNRTFWSRQVDVLAETYHVVTVDLGGHGESGTRRGDWNLAAFGDDVVAVVDAIAPGMSHSGGTRWVATPSCPLHVRLAIGSGVWCGPTPSGRSATRRRHRPRTSPGSLRPSTQTLLPPSTATVSTLLMTARRSRTARGNSGAGATASFTSRQ
jgi:hypothetical protein